jgi:hypothetical protein
MIECIFTIDYEIYGNGEGSLRDLVYEPAERLKKVFQERKARFVTFVEVAELEMIEMAGTDQAIDLVKSQIRDLHGEGSEIGLHLHPQWYNGRYENGEWSLDYGEYNLCTLPRERMQQMVDRSIAYLKELIRVPDFVPFSFRAGNWLFQPSASLSLILAEKGIRLDSSVFKGGVQRLHKLDYRRALGNGDYWKFSEDVTIPDPEGVLLELPIYVRMVPPWEMLTGKRIGLQRKSPSGGRESKGSVQGFMDLLRIRHPLKFDFCRMTLSELTHMMDTIIRQDRQDPDSLRPIVAIGHTKDLIDLEAIKSFLSYLEGKRIPISTFQDIYDRCKC